MKLSKLEGDYYTYLAWLKADGEADTKELGFQEIVLPKGEYEREVIIDCLIHNDQISEQFEKIESKNIVDPQRFFVEFYKSQKELILMVPIKWPILWPNIVFPCIVKSGVLFHNYRNAKIY